MDKYQMFRNFMYNELHITKEDIHQWIRDAVEEQANRLVANEFGKFDVERMASRIFMDDQFFGSKRFKSEIIEQIVKELRIRISVNNEPI